MQLARYLKRWLAAANFRPEAPGGRLVLFALCCGLAILLAMLSARGVTIARPCPDAALVKSIAGLFCVLPLAKGPLHS